MITIENDRVVIQGFGSVPVLDEHDRRIKQVQAVVEDHPLFTLGEAVGLAPEPARALNLRLRSVVERESVWARESLEPTYNEIVAAMRGSDIGAKVREAENISGNKDLRPEVARERANAAYAEAVESVHGALERIVAKRADRLANWETAIIQALKPEPAEGHGIVVRELRCREVREHLAGLDVGSRFGVLLEAARAGRVESLAAVMDHPLSIDLLEDGQLPRLQREALEHLGGGFLLLRLEDERGFLEHLGVVVSVIVMSVGGGGDPHQQRNLQAWVRARLEASASKLPLAA